MVTRAALIEGQEKTVVTPIIKKITEEVETLVLGNAKATNYLKTNYDKENVNVGNNVYNNTLGKPLLEINYEIKPLETLTVNTSRIFPLSKPILYDKDTKFTVTPYYQEHEITVNFTYSSKSKQQILNIKNRLYTFFINSEYKLYLDLPYSFQLPYSVLILANEIKTLKGSELDLIDYIKSIKTEYLDISFLRSNIKWRIPTFRGIQINRICNIMTDPREIEVEKQDQPQYSIQFQVLTTYHQPMGVFTDIPFMVNNKPINQIWLGKQQAFKDINVNHNGINFLTYLNNIYLTGRLDSSNIIKIPLNDEFAPVFDGSSAFDDIIWLSILITIENNDPDKLFNLNDLNHIGIPKSLVKYMKKYKDNLFKFGGCGIRLELYEFNYIKDKQMYTDDKYNVKVKLKLDKTKIYHVVFRFVTNMTLLSDLTYEQKEETKKLFSKLGIIVHDDDNNAIARHKYTPNGIK